MIKRQHIEHLEPDWDMSLEDWLAITGAAIGCFMAILDIQITNASLRDIQASLGLDLAEGSWISTSYLIAEIIAIPLTAFFSKVFGLRRCLIWNSLFFILASILCGASWNLQSLILARILQGISGGALIPLAFQVVLLYMPQHKKNFGLALFGIISTLAPTLGPALGGWLTDNWGWRFIFFINCLPGFLMTLAISLGLPDSKIFFHKLKNLDFAGVLTMIIGLSALTYMLEEGARVEWFEDGRIKICFLLVLVSLPTFIFIELYSKNPILNLRLLGKPEFGITAIMTMMAAMALYGGVYALSLYLGQVQGYSASQIGKVMMWSGIPQLLIMPLVPWLMQKWDSRWLIAIGFSLFALSNQMNSALNSFYSGDQFTFSLIIRALGQPLFIIPLSSMGMGMVAPSDAASASAIYNVLRNLGGSIGIAITSTFAISREALHYNRHFETLTATDLNLNQAITGVQHYFVIWGGMELGRAKAAAIQILSKLVHREALIETFSDVFQILCFGLLGCLFCTILLKKQKLVTKGTGTVISE